MASQITVFRSADDSASEDAAKVLEMLKEENIPAALFDDDSPGVPEGAYEVRVDTKDQARAEHLIARFSPDAELENPDPSHTLDLVTVFRSEGATNEMEAMSVQSLLDAGGIASVIVGDSRYPNFPQEVRVAKEHLATARQLIEEALAAGPSGAAEAEKSPENV